MKISVLTLFPDIINEYTNHSIIKIIKNNNLANIEVLNIRDYSLDKHRKVDDTIYGGGPGLVMSIEPIVNCLQEMKKENSRVVLLTPTGKKYTQELAKKFSKMAHLILICGHYEGIDERILNYIDLQLSIGDFVLTGGEAAALVVLDSVLRLLPGSINKDSLEVESFNDYLLDYPVYTKPEVFEGYAVPKVLLSGNHKEINEYRLRQREIKTKINRPDLYEKYLEKKGN